MNQLTRALLLMFATSWCVCASAAECFPTFNLGYDNPTDPKLQSELEKIDATLRAKLGMTTNQTAAGILDLKTCRLALVNPDRGDYAASVAKVGILLAYFATHPEAATNIDPVVKHELGLMAKASSNEMAAKYSRLLGLKNIQSVLNKYDLYNTNHGGGIWVGRHYGGGGERYGDPIGDNSHAATVRQLLRYFLWLEQGKLVSPTASKTMREIFASPDIPHDDIKFVKGLAGRDLQIIRKWGTWQDWLHDCAVITGTNRHYILIAMTKHPKGDEYLVGLSKAVDDLMKSTSDVPAKQHSAFYPPDVMRKIRANLKHDPNGKTFLERATNDAAFWRNKTDEQLRELVFSPGITRSWMVWSDGYCPSCKKPVRMYDWKIEAQKQPWKLHCPNCGEIFPKNDFYAFYKSGLDEKGWFDQKRADRSLLFNTEHPDATDPLHMFGVDDGEGYVADGHRWRFMGAYEIYGQFKQLIFNGTRAMARAYVLTGDEVYAHKAGILLDRLADFYPSFDYAAQGLVYEARPYNGYISVWHDACEETRELALAYDQIFDGFRDETKRRNIENGLLHHPLLHPERVHSNFPRAEMTLATIKTVLAWPDNRSEVEAMIDRFAKQASAVDGVTGEKGLSGYTSFTIAGLASFLEQYCRADPTFLHNLIGRVPTLTNTWRFHIDTFCLDSYYPRSGDCSGFAKPTRHYVGANFDKAQVDVLAPSMYSFFWRLYEETRDPAYVQILYRENDRATTNLPRDLFADDPPQFQTAIRKVIHAEGEELKLGSINKEAWHLAILRSGKGKNARALWLDYDSGGAHGHFDGMTLGLFAHGLDLLPDFGYPPVQFGGWLTPRAHWYTMTAAHNTVLVQQNQAPAAGKTTLWADGEMFHAVRADAPAMVGGKQYERTAALIDVDDKNFYVLDIFRTVAGAAHYKFVYGPYATLTTSNLNLQPTDKDPVAGGQLRNFAIATNPPTGWSAEWNVEDRLHLLPPKTNVRMRYTDFSQGVDVITNEAWTATMTQIEPRPDKIENWIPCLITRKTGPSPLSSTFVSVLEPFEGRSVIKRINRVPLDDGSGEHSDTDVALCIELNSGDRDLLIIADRELGGLRHIDVHGWYVDFQGEWCWLRCHRNRLKRVAMGNALSVSFHHTEIDLSEEQPLVEVDFTKRTNQVVDGHDVRIVVNEPVAR